MDINQPLDFIEFALLPYLSRKEIQLLQLKITQAKIKDESKKNDLLYQNCFYFKKALDLVQKNKKNQAQHLNLEAPAQNLNAYFDFTKLNAKDIFILLSRDRYKIDDTAIALILHTPLKSIEFRRIQLTREYKSVTTLDLANITPATHLVPTLGLNNLPTPARFFLEMGTVMVVLFFVLWLVPEMRKNYETSVQKRINEYLVDASLIDSPEPAGIAKPTPFAVEENTAESITPAPTLDVQRKQPKVTDGEIWRFSFTGQGQNDLENEINSLLKTKQNVSVKALVVPGGIQFDFTLPTEKLISLKQSLEELAQTLHQKQNINLSWYKKKKMGARQIPGAHVQVIIWISTL